MISAFAFHGARQETGEPSPSTAGAADVPNQIARLAGLPRNELRILWAKLHRHQPPKRLGRDLLVRAIAYSIQERAYGGLGLATKRRLRSLARQLDSDPNRAFEPGPSLKLGAKLVREWHGRTYTVTVLPDAFEFEGRRYRSLTMIARVITGSHRSGPLFFGVGNGPPLSRQPRPDRP